MSDVMLLGVLRMPYELAMHDELSRRQFYERAQEAADRIEAADSDGPQMPPRLNHERGLWAEVERISKLQTGGEQ